MPAYLANGSNDTSIRGAGFVVSLALLLNFSEWANLTCDARLA